MENKIKKSWFNVKLYLDGLKQLRIIGIMGAVIMACAAILIPLGYNIDNANYRTYYSNTGYSEIVGRVVAYDFLEMNPIIITAFFVAVPLMTLYLFNFINRRNACDFYHAIPDTRESFFLSYGGAVLTWAMALVVESALLSMISAGLLQYVELSSEFFGQMAITVANSFAGAVFLFGVFAIAMSITGTNFTNLAVAAMILVTPRLIVTVVVAIITDMIPVIPFTFGDSILDDRLNVVTNLVTGVLFSGEYEALNMWKSFLYTLIVGCLYSGIGMWLFKKRKSEAATAAAINSKLQCVLRLIPAMLISLIPIFEWAQWFLDDYNMYTEDIFMFVVLYTMAVIAYLLYELITTRKLKNLIKALPGLGWLVVYNIFMVVMIIAGYHILLNDVPDADDVDSVQISFGNYYYNYGYDRDYYASKLEDIVYDSPEIIELLTSELERNVEALKNGESLYGNRHQEPGAEVVDVTYGETLKYQNGEIVESYIDMIEVNFDCGFFDKNRRVYLSRKASTQLIQLMENNEAILDALYEPVAFDEISSITFSDYDSTEEVKKALYEIYLVNIEETKALGFKRALNTALNVNSGEKAEVEFSVYLKNEKRFNVVITTETPNSYKMYVDLCNRLGNGKEPLDEFLTEYEKYSNITAYEGPLDTNANIRFSIYEDGKLLFNTSANWNFWKYDENKIDANRNFTDNGEKILRNIGVALKKVSDKEIDFTKMYVNVSVEIYDYAKEEWNGNGSVVKFYQIDEKTFEDLCEYDGRNPETVK